MNRQRNLMLEAKSKGMDLCALLEEAIDKGWQQIVLEKNYNNFTKNTANDQWKRTNDNDYSGEF